MKKVMLFRTDIVNKIVKNKFFALLLVAIMTFVFVFCESTFTNSDAYAATARTQSQAVSWANSQIGKSLDYDGAYGAQCVDLIKYYYNYFGYANYAKGNACNYISNSLPSGWSRVYSPKKGDIAVFKTNYKYTGAYGHVGIVVGVSGSTLSMVNQNFNYQSYCTKNTFTTDQINCYIRPSYTSTKNVDSRVQTVVLNIHKHSFSSWQIVTKATCTSNGLEKRTCKCGSYETRSIPATGHFFSEWEVRVEPSCETSGEEFRTCQYCGKEETSEINALGHNYQHFVCDAKEGIDGYSYDKCTKCEDMINFKVIEAKDEENVDTSKTISKENKKIDAPDELDHNQSEELSDNSYDNYISPIMEDGQASSLEKPSIIKIIITYLKEKIKSIHYFFSLI